MDTKKVPHVSINRYLLLSIGLWPTNAKILRGIQKFIITVIILSSFYPQIGALVMYRDNYNTCCRIIMCLMPSVVYCIKFFNFAFETSHRMTRTLKWIQTDWETYVKKGERGILEERGKSARTIIVLYLVIIYPALIAGALFPYVRYGYNCLTQKNSTNIVKTPMMLEYYVLDEKKHMHWIVLHANTFYLVGSHAVIVTEMTTLMVVEHACALFELVSYYLNTAIEETIMHPSETVVHRCIKTIVQVHYRALGFITFLNDNYLLHYAVLLIIGVVTLSLNLYIVSFADSLVNTHDVDALIMSGMLIVCHICYILMCTYAGQKIINESSRVLIVAYCSRWYLTPLPMQKFLMLFLERCLKISCFVSGGIVKPSLELLSSMLSMSMSYFMMLWSFS